jgi:hypothetical protein
MFLQYLLKTNQPITSYVLDGAMPTHHPFSDHYVLGRDDNAGVFQRVFRVGVDLDWVEMGNSEYVLFESIVDERPNASQPADKEIGV